MIGQKRPQRTCLRMISAGAWPPFAGVARKRVLFIGGARAIRQTLVISARPRNPDGRTNRISSRTAKAIASLKSDEM